MEHYGYSDKMPFFIWQFITWPRKYPNLGPIRKLTMANALGMVYLVGIVISWEAVMVGISLGIVSVKRAVLQ